MLSTIQIGNSRIDVTLESGDLAVSHDELLAWVRNAAESVAAYYQRYPVPHVALHIIPSGGRGVYGGRTFGADDGGSIRIHVGKSTTAAGLRMRAAAFNATIARLSGIRVARVLTVGWALAGLLGALAGVLVSPSTFLYPNSMDAIFVYGFTAAVIGGLDSPVGAVVGGLILGVVLSYAGGYVGGSVGSDLTSLVALGILGAVLMIRPEGLFGAARMRRV